jgi:hypothetical protein
VQCCAVHGHIQSGNFVLCLLLRPKPVSCMWCRIRIEGYACQQYVKVLCEWIITRAGWMELYSSWLRPVHCPCLYAMLVVCVCVEHGPLCERACTGSFCVDGNFRSSSIVHCRFMEIFFLPRFVTEHTCFSLSILRINLLKSRPVIPNRVPRYPGVPTLPRGTGRCRNKKIDK